MVDRQLVHPTVEVLDADILQSNKNTMVGLGYLAQAILGTGTAVDGLACAPTIPASMGVNVATGSIYSLGQIDATDYGTIPADTVNQIVKQGIVVGTTNFGCPAPGSVGQSVVYLVQAKFQENDGGATNLPYIDATDGSVSYAITNTVRQGVCVLALKTGTAATTGTQATPSPDSGYVGLWAITVANGATTITSGNIAQASGAPFIGAKLTAKIATIKRQVLTANTTYLPSSGLLFADVEVQASGAGGGGSSTGGSGTSASNGTGGGAGGYTRKLLTAAAIGTSQAVTVGTAGGAGGANASGGAGNTSSFGAILTASGGSPGSPQGPATVITVPTASGVGGTASGGDVNRAGGDGRAGVLYGGSTQAIGGDGGNSALGDGGRGGGNSAGNAATGYGAGGGGAGSSGSNSYVGGAGTGGIVIVTEYCSQ